MESGQNLDILDNNRWIPFNGEIRNSKPFVRLSIIDDTQCFKIVPVWTILIDSAMDLNRNPDLAEDTIPSDSSPKLNLS